MAAQTTHSPMLVQTHSLLDRRLSADVSRLLARVCPVRLHKLRPPAAVWRSDPPGAAVPCGRRERGGAEARPNTDTSPATATGPADGSATLHPNCARIWWQRRCVRGGSSWVAAGTVCHSNGNRSVNGTGRPQPRNLRRDSTSAAAMAANGDGGDRGWRWWCRLL